MEVRDVVRRIIGQHWRLIASLVVVCMSAVVFLALERTAQYTASTRIVLDTEDPTSRWESSAVADTVNAIATSNAQLTGALADAKVTGRDVTDMARRRVSAVALGGSPIVKLSVTDRDPRVAAAVANRLAQRVIQTRLEVTRGQATNVTGNLDRRIGDVTRQIAGLDSQLDALTVSVAAARPAGRANQLRARRDQVAQQRDILTQSRAVLEAQRVSLLSSEATQRNPRVVSAATPPATADHSALAQDLILSGFLGLILGVGLAGIKETLRPTLVGSDTIAHELDTPLLGSLSGGAGPLRERELVAVGERVRLAAKAASVRNVRLLPATDGAFLDDLAERLTGIAPAASPAQAPVAIAVSAQAVVPGADGLSELTAADESAVPQFRVRPYDVQSVLTNGVVTGVVVVSPDRLERSDLARATDLLRISPAPLLGLITFRAPRRSKWRGRRGARHGKA